jgi:nucleotide-binding universal stress UspA family protein
MCPSWAASTLFEAEVWEGTPYVEITKFARQKACGPDRHGPPHPGGAQEADKAKLGSTMEQVVMRSVCPVMSVNH